ncbi:hypothetical protein B7486_70610 [cyanobacterium TDX16]|nr:hypothetical protein B7486_70610 [cyanobacterium TDX16]
MMAGVDFDESFEDLLRIALRTSMAIVRNRHDAEEVAAETLVRASERWGRIGGHATPWVVRVSTNLSFDSLRARRRRERPRTSALAADPPLDASAAARLDVLEALAGLPRRQREVLVLQHACGYTAAQVAELLGISVGSVKQHGNRGRRALKADQDRGLAGAADPRGLAHGP